MRVFIIGGTGFISGRLVRMLLAEGHDVTIFTRGRTENPHPGHPRLSVRLGDRRDRTRLREAASEHTYDAVYDMIAYEAADSQGAVDVFRGRTGRFVHCSTVSVYMVSGAVRCPVTEDQDRLPAREHDPRNPFGTGYGLGKRGCEEVLWAAHDPKAFPVTMLRPTFVSGPGDPGRRDAFWIERILDGGPLLVPGSGDHAFQQVYVDDAARAFADVLGRPETAGRAYNVAAEEVYSLDEYLGRLSALLGREPERVHVDRDVFDRLPFSTFPGADVFPFATRRTAVFSLDRVKRDLGYWSTPFETWMQATVDAFLAAGIPSNGYARRAEEVAFVRRWQQHRARMVEAVLG